MHKILDKNVLKNIPWEECPKGYEGPIWRYSNNPIINRHPNSEISRSFNSAVVYFNNEFIGAGPRVSSSSSMRYPGSSTAIPT